ncbi:RAMP superfamily CRISPR-associated protein [Mahella sp.]|uniref:RAMP superfamily CRISPR-associated protein n=1 Tax=Mahella sp. TaxID=2798721 RepID=UPI0025C54E44|nr:RAMP superfamily CRISPR-associated protein [Mahella sp.]MBZ4665025.1 hypothetical protein [Mahella sp.]
MRPQWENGHGVKERILINADLVLDTPTHIGCSEGKDLADMQLLLYEIDNLPLLMGSSIAGALRAYLERAGFKEEASKIFGNMDKSKSCPSIVFVEDSFGRLPDGVQVEVRDGVAISLNTGTAIDTAKFDMELLPEGTVFPLSFEFMVLENDCYADTLGYFVSTLKALEEGEIPIGRRKRRGLGRCHAKNFKVYRYNMSKPEGLIGWLEKDKNEHNVKGIDDLPIKNIGGDKDKFVMKASFEIDGSILIGSQAVNGNDPDIVHIHSFRDGSNTPILSGTSLAGSLRSRAYKIINTIGADVAIVNEIFGTPREEKKDRRASRLWVYETTIDDSKQLVQNRIKIDRFTGGAYSGALFNEQPIFAGKVEVKLALDGAQEREIGLLLLLLKDLWTSNLPIGRGTAIGRGRFKGLKAELDYNGDYWRIEQRGEKINVRGSVKRLESFVQALWRRENNGQ